MPASDRPVEDAAEPSGEPRAVDRQALGALVRRAADDIYGVSGAGRTGWRDRLLRAVGRGTPAGRS